jgi:hypothetical protein
MGVKLGLSPEGRPKTKFKGMKNRKHKCKEAEVTGDRRKYHNEKVRLFTLCQIIKPRRMEVLVACIRKVRNRH